MRGALVSIALALGAYLLGYNRGYDQGYDQAQKDTSEEVGDAHRVARAYQALHEELVPNTVLYRDPLDHTFRTPPLEDQ